MKTILLCFMKFLLVALFAAALAVEQVREKKGVALGKFGNIF